MAEQKTLGRAIFTSFIVAVAVILFGAFAAPRLQAESGCSPSYGVDPCASGMIVSEKR
jgi:hypothetical protein